MCKRAFNNRVLPILPEFPKFSRINEERPTYFAKDLKKIVNEYYAEYKELKTQMLMKKQTSYQCGEVLDLDQV